MDSHKSGLWKGRLCDDGILAEMYNYVWLIHDGVANGSTLLPEGTSLSLSIPDTILYERGFPKAWYAWEKAARGDGERTLRKHLGKDIAVPAIIKKFCSGILDEEVVVAEYITLESTSTHPQTSKGGRGPVHVQYLTHAGLAAFLSGRAPGSIGVLQRFVPTQGMFNTAYEIVWSPSATSIAQARSAVPMSDALLPVRERFATFDADATQLRRVKISPQSQIRDKLLSAVSDLMHIMTSTESIPLLGVVAYCKIDVKGAIWLTFCSSIRCKTVQSANGVRDPLEVGADFKERSSAAHDAALAMQHLPPSKPKNSAVNMRSLPPQVRVHVVAGGRTSPIILGQAYDRTARSQSLADTSTVDNDERWHHALSRLDALHAVQMQHSPPKAKEVLKSAVDLPKTSSELPEDHHTESRHVLLLFLEDMVYLTRANRDRNPNQSRVAAEANASLPSFFNDGIDFHFRIPPVLDRALGTSGLATICRILGWKRTASLSDAHGHNADFFSFPWRAPVATNDDLLRVVMTVYPPVVVRKGRRSVAARSASASPTAHTHSDDDDDDEDDDRQLLAAPPTGAKLSRGQAAMESSSLSANHVGEERLSSSVEQPLLHIEPLLFPLTLKRNEPPPAQALKKRYEWHMVSSFPEVPAPPRTSRKPLSARDRELKCKLTAARKRIYYPEGTQNKPGPAIQRLTGVKQPVTPDTRSPLSEAAAQYMKKRNSPDKPDDWAQRAPFAGDTTETEQRPLDIMMQFWTQ